jgi:hypothetical protein
VTSKTSFSEHVPSLDGSTIGRLRMNELPISLWRCRWEVLAICLRRNRGQSLTARVGTHTLRFAMLRPRLRWECSMQARSGSTPLAHRRPGHPGRQPTMGHARPTLIRRGCAAGRPASEGFLLTAERSHANQHLRWYRTLPSKASQPQATYVGPQVRLQGRANCQGAGVGRSVLLVA